MDLILYLNEFLQDKGKVVLPKFGTLILHQKHAELDSTSSKLLPPTKTITFEYDTKVIDPCLSKYIAEKSGENLFLVQTQIAEMISNWIEILNKEKKISIQNIGSFVLAENNIFLENKNALNINSSYFGLEEIEIEPNPTISEIEIRDTQKEQDYKTSKSKIWIIILLILVLAILAFAFLNPEIIFGKKSVL